MQSEILENLKKLFCFLFCKAPASVDDLAMQDHFRKKYKHFQELLDSNSELLKIVSDLELKLQGSQLFGMSYVRTQATRAVFHALRLAASFESLSGKPNPNLRAKVDEIQERIKAELESRKDSLPLERILEYSQVTREMVDAVGGK
ncbi:MAG: pyruvate, phosphate dikinase, partial [Humidesulfovibrio sp.]|nr:pyruvate, phosphate dikinase [Humidesulfovibrio sp.]